MDLQLKDRVYIVTGGARGLGRATADVLVADGAKVVISGRNAESLAEAPPRSATPRSPSRPTTATRPPRLASSRRPATPSAVSTGR